MKQTNGEKKKVERTGSSFLVKLLILILLLAAGFQLWNLSGQVSKARQQKEDLAAQVAMQEQENSALRADIQEGPTAEKMEELAREEGYVGQGEYVFDIIGLDEDEEAPQEP